MRKTGWLLTVLIIPVIFGCQQAQQKKTSEVGRKQKLMAAENIELKTELAQNKNELEKQNKLLQQCRQEIEKITNQAANDANANQKLKNELTQCRLELENQKKLLEHYQKIVDLKDIPELCREKLEKQKKLLERCRRENEKIQTEAGETSEFLMKQLPAGLTQQVEQLSQENEQLKAKIEELEKTQKEVNEVQKEQ